MRADAALTDDKHGMYVGGAVCRKTAVKTQRVVMDSVIMKVWFIRLMSTSGYVDDKVEA